MVSRLHEAIDSTDKGEIPHRSQAVHQDIPEAERALHPIDIEPAEGNWYDSGSNQDGRWKPGLVHDAKDD